MSVCVYVCAKWWLYKSDERINTYLIWLHWTMFAARRQISRDQLSHFWRPCCLIQLACDVLLVGRIEEQRTATPASGVADWPSIVFQVPCTDTSIHQSPDELCCARKVDAAFYVASIDGPMIINVYVCASLVACARCSGTCNLLMFIDQMGGWFVISRVTVIGRISHRYIFIGWAHSLIAFLIELT